MRTSEEFFETYDKKRWSFDGTYEERMDLGRKLFADWYNEADVGDHMHICHYSDIDPCTVVKRTPKSITVRMDKAELSPDWKPEFILGGFAAHCINNDEQKWIISEDPNGPMETFRWHKRENCFMNSAGEKLLPGWMKKYDYNF